MRKIVCVISLALPLIFASATIKKIEPLGCGPKGVQLYQGPKGGCYYINDNGNKTYVDRDCCN